MPSAPGSPEAAYLGQICEVQWLRHLKTRFHIHDPAFPALSPQPGDTNFYLIDDGAQLLQDDNPFHLPSQDLAMVLFQCYFHTVHVTYPIVPVELQSQLQFYYQSMRNAHPIAFPQRWYGIVNVVLAIGARFSRLIDAEWHTDKLEENIYLSRACQLLCLGESTFVLGAPDLSLVQVLLRSCQTDN